MLAQEAREPRRAGHPRGHCSAGARAASIIERGVCSVVCSSAIGAASKGAAAVMAQEAVCGVVVQGGRHRAPDKHRRATAVVQVGARVVVEAARIGAPHIDAAAVAHIGVHTVVERGALSTAGPQQGTGAIVVRRLRIECWGQGVRTAAYLACAIVDQCMRAEVECSRERTPAQRWWWKRGWRAWRWAKG